MRKFRLPLATLAALLACQSHLQADLLPADRPIPTAVDHYIDTKLKAGTKPGAPLDDAAYLRRVSLDLLGRIPTTGELQTYLASKEADKKAKLVDRLLSAPGHVRHQVNEFDVLLAGENRASLRPYLTRALKENRPWDRIFREIMLPDETREETKGASPFLRSRARDLDRLTADVSVVFFGVNISCAQCHDHPLVNDWKQDHFYGMKAFLSRTYEAGPGFVGERAYGEVSFRTTKGVTKTAPPMFLTGTRVAVPPSKAPTPAEQKQELARAKGMKGPPPAPAFSIRSKLVETALKEGERDYFARAIVNRLWARLFGLGIVTPLDQMHSENPPSHPELLDWLARDLVANNYDLKRLVRGLVLSNAYARGSRQEGDATPSPRSFAVARVRPLTPMQLATSLRLAVTDPDELPGTMPADALDKRIEAMENGVRGFAALIEQPRDDFQVGVAEALLFSNSERFQKEFLGDGKDRLVTRLAGLKDIEQVVELAVRSVLTRSATTEEKKVLGDYLRARNDRPVEARRQLLWALVTSPEFRFNH